MRSTKGPVSVTDHRAAALLARVNTGGNSREKRPGRKTARATRPFPLQVSTRLNLLPDFEYCTLHFAAHSQPQTIEWLSSEREHKPKWREHEKDQGAQTKPSRHPPHKTCNAKSKHLIYLRGLTLSFCMDHFRGECPSSLGGLETTLTPAKEPPPNFAKLPGGSGATVGVIGDGYPKDGKTILQDNGASKAPQSDCSGHSCRLPVRLLCPAGYQPRQPADY